MLLGFLPFQGIRVERLDEEGQEHSSTVLTLAGWPGLQGLIWETLLNGPDGKPYPTRIVGHDTLIMRPKIGQDAAVGMVAARIKGTFMYFSDFATGQHFLTNHRPSGPVYDIAKDLDSTQDSFGVLLNRKNSLLRFLEWLDDFDFSVIEKAVGAERFRTDIAVVDYVAWTGALVDEDRMELDMRFRLLDESKAEELEQMLTTARQALKTQGRAANLQITTIRNDMLCRVQMTGYRQMLLSYLKN
jgi:hypothetical protein